MHLKFVPADRDHGWYYADENGQVILAQGQPIPVSGLARMQLQAQPDGQYRLINPRTGRPVPNRQGRPWEFDIDTDERHAALRRAMPDLIRPRR